MIVGVPKAWGGGTWPLGLSSLVMSSLAPSLRYVGLIGSLVVIGWKGDDSDVATGVIYGVVSSSSGFIFTCDFKTGIMRNKADFLKIIIAFFQRWTHWASANKPTCIYTPRVATLPKFRASVSKSLLILWRMMETMICLFTKRRNMTLGNMAFRGIH